MMNSQVPDRVVTRPVDGVELIALEPRTVVGLRERVALSEISTFFARAIPFVMSELARAGAGPAGPPVAVYRHEQRQEFDVTVGFPVSEPPTSTDALVQEELPGGPAVQGMHIGPYDTLSATYEALSKYFAERRLTPPDVMWEEYLVGPEAGNESAYRTRVVYPLR